MEMPVAEVADRFTILLLKLGHGLPVEKEIELFKEAFAEEAWWCRTGMARLLVELFRVNAAIWQLEWQVRQGRDGELSLEEIGRRALEIRNWNAKRIALKNDIADLTNGPREIKTAHASEATE